METNNTSPAKKDSILKSLAIAGFLAILLIVAWLAIQLVQYTPSAFSSLASLAEGVNQSQESTIDPSNDVSELVVTSNTSLLNNGEDMTIQWSKVNAAGNYIFSYECVDGVAIEHQSASGARAIACDTDYAVGDISTLTLAIDSEKNRYADVPYTIAFVRNSESTPRAVGESTVTIVNTSINSEFALGPVDESPVVTEEVTEEIINPVVEPEVAPVVPTTPARPTTPRPAAPVVTQQFVYAIPVSDPQGTTDLDASFVAVGEVINRAFVPGPVSVNNDGAIQFVVKNIGTKTSTAWSFSVDLPSGDVYQSPTQVALKPNERAILTIGFPAGGSALHKFEVKVLEATDRNTRNNSFTQTVGFSR